MSPCEPARHCCGLNVAVGLHTAGVLLLLLACGISLYTRAKLPSGHGALRRLKKHLKLKQVQRTDTSQPLFQMTHSFDCKLHVQNKKRLVWVLKMGSDSVSNLKQKKEKKVCVCLVFEVSKKKDIIAVDRRIKVIILGYDLENCFGHIVLPWQRTVIGFCGASRLEMVEGFSPTPTQTTLRLSVTLDGIAHDQSNRVPFFSCFCSIRPGNVTPASMYKVI